MERYEEEEYLACCGSTQFAKEMVKASPFASVHEAVAAARDIWFNKVDVNGWLEAFSAHPQIGQSPSPNHPAAAAQWSKGEQSTALATATTSTLQELLDWNARYRHKFGFIFLICASGRSTAEILADLKKRYPNRPIVEFEIAAQEQMKVTELRLVKLFSSKIKSTSKGDQHATVSVKKAEDRVSIIGGHLTKTSESSFGKASQISTRTRPPITTHVLDVSQGSPAAGVEVCLEIWKGTHPRPLFGEPDVGGWVIQGSSTTDGDGRSGQLMSIVDVVNPGIYRISFNTERVSHASSYFTPHARCRWRVPRHTVAGDEIPTDREVRLVVFFLPRWRVYYKYVCGRSGNRLKTPATFLSLPCTSKCRGVPHFVILFTSVPALLILFFLLILVA